MLDPILANLLGAPKFEMRENGSYWLIYSEKIIWYRIIKFWKRITTYGLWLPKTMSMIEATFLRLSKGSS